MNRAAHLTSSLILASATLGSFVPACSSSDQSDEGATSASGGNAAASGGNAAASGGNAGRAGMAGTGGAAGKAGAAGAGASGKGGASGSGSGSAGAAAGGTGASGATAGVSGLAGTSGAAGAAGTSAGAAGVAGKSAGGGPSGASGAGGGAGGGPTCSSTFSDPLAAQRATCAFGAGALPAATLGASIPSGKKLPIEHIIVMMKENRAFDHLLGKLAEAGQPGTEAIPASFTNPDGSGQAVAPFHATTTCIPHDPGHQWNEMHAQVDGGKMDGFITSAAKTTGTDGLFAMSWYDYTDLPFYYWLASTYALNDRHFASARSGTFPDRNFLLFGTAGGVKCTGCGYPSTSANSIFKELDEAGVSWAAYTDGDYFSGTLGKPQNYVDASHLRGGVVSGTQAFLKALEAPDFPAVVFVDGDDNVTDEHPTANLQAGEDWSRQIYTALVKSAYWPSSALLWTYDEAGGFADHVPPPPDDPQKTTVCLDGDPKDGSNFGELGVRVPMAVISPYARPHYVSHVVQEHTAITRFIETVFDLPALTQRDANSDALLDMFDFDCAPALLSPPIAPAAGTAGCGASTVHLTTDKPLYAPGEAIQVTFENGPGNDALDWIAVYAYGEVPHSGSLVWVRIDGERTNTPMACPAGCPAKNTVTLQKGDENGTNWPLPVGQYVIYYLVNDQYTSLGSVDFIVQ